MQPKCNHNFLLSLTWDDGRFMHAGGVCQKVRRSSHTVSIFFYFKHNRNSMTISHKIPNVKFHEALFSSCQGVIFAQMDGH